MVPNQMFDEFQKGMSEFLAKTPAADLERNMKAFMQQAFSRMDLITREEFDVQVELLSRALERVQSLEARVQALEAARGVSAPEGVADGPLDSGE